MNDLRHQRRAAALRLQRRTNVARNGRSLAASSSGCSATIRAGNVPAFGRTERSGEQFEDETWSDQGDRGTGVFSHRFDIQEFSAITALRAEILSRVLPHTAITDRCKIEKTAMEVRGQLGTYRIQLGWGAAALVADSGMRWLKIPQRILDAVTLDLTGVPIELDHRTEMILRRAHVLANDWKIDSPELVRQLMPD